MSDYLKTFEDSYQRALGHQSYKRDFIERFYDIFLGQFETIANMFRNTSMSTQKTMLHDSLNRLVEFYPRANRSIEY